MVIAYDRRFASEHFAAAAAEVAPRPRHPGRVRHPCGPDPDELVRGRPARARRPGSSSPPATTRGSTTASRSRRRPARPPAPDILGVIEARLAENGGHRRSTGGPSPTPRRPVSSNGSTRSRATSGSSGRTVDLDALKAADIHVLVDPMWGAGARLAHPPARPAGGSASTRSTRSATRTSAASTRSRSGPNIDEALGMPRRRRLRPRPVPRRRRGPRRRGRTSAATFIHQLQVTGLLMYYLAEHRGWRDPVVVSVNNTSMAARLGEHYGITTYETPVGFKFIGPKMIETGAMMGAEESGGFGFGMHLPERDGVYADLLLLDLFLRERAAGRWPVSQGHRALPRAGRPVVLPPRRRPRRARRVPRDQAAAAGRPARVRRRPSWPARPGRPDRCRSTPATASSSSSRTARGCSSGRRAPSRWSGSTRRPPRAELRDALLVAGERLVRGS